MKAPVLQVIALWTVTSRSATPTNERIIGIASVAAESGSMESRSVLGVRANQLWSRASLRTNNSAPSAGATIALIRRPRSAGSRSASNKTLRPRPGTGWPWRPMPRPAPGTVRGNQVSGGDPTRWHDRRARADSGRRPHHVRGDGGLVLLDVDRCAAVEQLGTQLGAALQQNGFHPVLVAGVMRRGAQPVAAGQCER